MLKEPPNFLNWISTICTILGISFIEIFQRFFPSILDSTLARGIIAVLATAAVGCLFTCSSTAWTYIIILTTAAVGCLAACLSVKKIEKKYQAQLEEKNDELESKALDLGMKDTELEKRDSDLKETREECRKAREAAEVLRKILDTQIPAQAGYYLENKKQYDIFRTNLIANCSLDVSLEKTAESKEADHLHFKWELTVWSSTSTDERIIHFIYSGDKNDNTSPRVMMDGKSLSFSMIPKKVVGDYRFMEIRFPKGFVLTKPVTITIDYILPKYRFNRKYDYIWLVPDALGFARIDEFRIRFFSDGEIIKKTTGAVLRTYMLDGEFNPDRDTPLDFKTFGEDREGFECVRSNEDEKFNGLGYLMILINDKESLPDYLKPLPT